MKNKRYSVTFKKSALKELESLPIKIQRRVLDAAHLLAINPYSELLQIKKLKGLESVFRIRIGDYRVIYEIEKNEIKIIVIKIGHRQEVYT